MVEETLKLHARLQLRIDLLRAAEAVAQNVKELVIHIRLRGGTEFGQRLGQKIEVLRRGNKKIYIVRSNVRGFSLNFRPSARIFGDLIADALHVEKNTVSIDVPGFIKTFTPYAPNLPPSPPA